MNIWAVLLNLAVLLSVCVSLGTAFLAWRRRSMPEYESFMLLCLAAADRHLGGDFITFFLVTFFIRNSVWEKRNWRIDASLPIPLLVFKREIGYHINALYNLGLSLKIV